MVEKISGSGRFRDRVVIVTGAAGGIGSAAARRFSREGARVVLADLPSMAGKANALADACRADGASDALVVACDVSRESDVAAAVEAATTRFDHLDVLVNVAGYMIFKPLIDISAEEWRRMMDVNLMGAVYFTQRAMRTMKPGGAIVNVSSIHAFQTSSLVAPYAAAKAAMLSLTRSTAIEGKALHIRANAVAPGAIDTQLLRSSPNIASGEEHVPPDMLGQPEDIAGVIAFLASDEAAFVNGSVLTADGGRLTVL